MKKYFTLNYLCVFIFLIMGSFAMSGQTTVTGTITDDITGDALIGANVIVEGTTSGTITDFDGMFTLTTDQSPPFSLEISYTGYTTATVAVSSNNQNLNIKLTEGVLIGEDVVISASRRKEKVQEAPASVSVLSAKRLAGTPQATDPTRNLIAVPGVQITQQSAGRINIEMRGGVGLFGTGAFPIKDYRSLVGPGIGTFDSNGAGLSNIDMARVEVVRGAGSALYGPGVTAGVVHFISKNPIDYPGTTVELVGGELNTIGASLRHAGTNVNKTFGYKINASYKKGDEFTLDGSEGTTTASGTFNRQIDKFQPTIVQPGVSNGVVDAAAPAETLLTLTPRADGNVMQDFWESQSADVTFELRPSSDLSITTSAGYNRASAVFYNDQGEGLSQFQEFWGQARAQLGGLFAQVFVVNNDGGSKDRPTFLYQTGNRTPVGRKQLEGQLQYNFDTPSFLGGEWTTGVDYRSVVQDTENLVYGSNEDKDDYSIIGGYVQGKFGVGKKLDIVAAGRYDKFNFIKDSKNTSFSPRLGLVYKASPKHTFRATYNYASFAPSALQYYIDFPVSSPVPGLFDIWLAGQNEIHEFDANPVIDVSIPGVPDLPYGTPGLPLAVPYGAVAQPVIAGVLAALGQNPATAPLVPALQQFFSTYVPSGFTGSLVGVNLFDGTLLSDLTPTIPGQLGSTQTYEVGYKGLLGDKFGLSLDVYRITTNGSSDFTQIGPSISLVGANVGPDLGTQVGTDVGAFLATLGLPQANIDALVPLIAGGFQQGGDGFTAQAGALFPIFGAVESNQVPQNDNIVHVPAGYRIFDSSYSRWGADLGTEYFATEDLSFLFNYSWLNDNEFTVDQNDGTGSTFQTFLNTPKNKYRIGVNYAQDYGLRANALFQHDDEFTSNNGQYSGIGQAKNLIDAGVGYKFENGLSVDLTAQNLFDNEYRAFPNMPLIGRRILGKITYEFGSDGPSDFDGDGISDKKDLCPNIAGIKAFNGCPDSDGDGIKDSEDDCPLVAGAINGCPDTDGDGVIDRDDQCPNAAGDLMGCPDADGDGIADKDDMCPNAAGNLSGCPDSDGDGVADKDDMCPNAAGNVGGCPDSDGDGVADKDDKCPNEAGDGADGCMTVKDSDGDGVMDDRDACPNTKGSVNGCPDKDNDGVADKDDRCPNRRGDAANNGCPKTMSAEVSKVFDRALSGIQFETGKAVIKSDSYSILDEIVSLMNADGGIKLKVIGHTDSQGNDDKNMDLSAKRAQTVVRYLVTKGIDGSRLTSSGLGELQPIGDNATAAGRKMNRRVEFRGSY